MRSLPKLKHRPGDRSWMDCDKGYEEMMRGLPLRPARPGLWLKRLREGANEEALRTRPNSARPLRLVTYAMLPVGTDPTADLARVRSMLERQDYHVAHSLYDLHGDQNPQRRPHWQEARRLVQMGFADGVAVTDRYAISAHDRHYEREVRWFGEHAALLLLDRHEAAT
ncbi:hypothetical protein ACIRPQ_28880 [Streptomyces sp. NPDC101213]|uniref:hypothetical protein n=1 Tax=Streptomyces sp. NPDC101213 TaxID=3366130 RepID=UPI003801D123